MALNTGIVSAWKLDESSGNAADSVGSNTLTNNNTVSYVAAKINNGGDFGTANTNKSFSNASNLGLGINPAALTISGWVRMNTEIGASTQEIFAIENTGLSSVNIRCYYDYNAGTRQVVFGRQKIGTSFDNVAYAITMGTASYHHIVITYDGTNITGYVDGTASSNVASSGTGTGSASNRFSVGEFGSTSFLSAKVDEVYVWSRALSPSEVTELYNGGTGKQYPFVYYTIPLVQTSFSLTGYATLFSKNFNYFLTAASSSFSITGSIVTLTLRLAARFINQIKNVINPTNSTKSTASSFTNQTKNTINPINQPKP